MQPLTAATAGRTLPARLPVRIEELAAAVHHLRGERRPLWRREQ